MSIIVYGPQGCGKSINAETLRDYFCCAEVVDADYFDPFPLSPKQVEEFKEGHVLFLTNIDPIVKGYHMHYGRVFSYKQAATAAGIE